MIGKRVIDAISEIANSLGEPSSKSTGNKLADSLESIAESLETGSESSFIKAETVYVDAVQAWEGDENFIDLKIPEDESQNYLELPVTGNELFDAVKSGKSVTVRIVGQSVAYCYPFSSLETRYHPNGNTTYIKASFGDMTVNEPWVFYSRPDQKLRTVINNIFYVEESDTWLVDIN